MTLEETLRPGRSWDEMRADFRWEIPDSLNIADALVGARARAEPERLALRVLALDGARDRR